MDEIIVLAAFLDQAHGRIYAVFAEFDTPIQRVTEGLALGGAYSSEKRIFPSRWKMQIAIGRIWDIQLS